MSYIDVKKQQESAGAQAGAVPSPEFLKPALGMWQRLKYYSARYGVVHAVCCFHGAKVPKFAVAGTDYSEAQLCQALKAAGFVNITQSFYRDPNSKYGAFDSHPARFAFAPPEWSQYWEAQKPEHSHRDGAGIA